MFTYVIQITSNEFSIHQMWQCGGNLQIILQFCTQPVDSLELFFYIVKGAMVLFQNRISTEKENIECLPM